MYLFSKSCPWCNAPLSLRQMLMTMERLPSECPHCHKLFENPLPRELFVTFAAVVSGSLGIYVFALPIVPTIVIMMVAYVFLKAAFVKPVKTKYEVMVCSRCQRCDVGFRTPSAKICDDCLKTMEVHKV